MPWNLSITTSLLCSNTCLCYHLYFVTVLTPVHSNTCSFNSNIIICHFLNTWYHYIVTLYSVLQLCPNVMRFQVFLWWDFDAHHVLSRFGFVSRRCIAGHVCSPLPMLYLRQELQVYYYGKSQQSSDSQHWSHFPPNSISALIQQQDSFCCMWDSYPRSSACPWIWAWDGVEINPVVESEQPEGEYVISFYMLSCHWSVLLGVRSKFHIRCTDRKSVV